MAYITKTRGLVHLGGEHRPGLHTLAIWDPHHVQLTAKARFPAIGPMLAVRHASGSLGALGGRPTDG